MILAISLRPTLFQKRLSRRTLHTTLLLLATFVPILAACFLS